MAIDDDIVCTITLTSGSVNFTVAGTNLTTADIEPGDEIRLPAKGLTLTVGEVLTATTGKLTDNCPAAAAGAAQPARLRYQPDLSRAAAKFENLATLLGNGNVDALAGLALANNKGIHATGLNTLGTHDLTPFARTLLDDANAASVWDTLGATSPPNVAFRRGNILGTVSQAGGVPTGAIIERGSNANGEYVRFADGTQICHISTTRTDQSIDTIYGGLYIGAFIWTFPTLFSSNPSVACGQFRWGSSASWGSVTTSTTSLAILRGLDSFSRAAGSNTNIAVTAIGRWF